MKNIFVTLVLTVLSTVLFAQNATLSGSITDPYGDNVDVTSITLLDSGDNIVAVTSGWDFNFTGLTQGETYKLTFEKNESPLNGVSTFDIVLIIKDILGVQPLSSPLLLYAADVNASTTITVYDIVLLRRLILAIDSSLPVPSWQFLPASINSFPGATTFNEIEVTMSAQNIIADVKGFKMGDVNGSAIPN
ncbi:MAG: hypothetical protein DWQ02_24930 [Bacteroidetes bacterium]|nr:MAG: hypothetical protein DWQ02_24930 [Bacteroidota bacterium]